MHKYAGLRRKLPSVRAKKKGNGLEIRFQYQGVRYILAPVPCGHWTNKEHRAIANETAARIQKDIYIGQFDKSLVKYRLVHLEQPETLKTQWDIKTLWERYKTYKIQSGEVQETTINACYVQVDRCLGKLTAEELSLQSAKKLFAPALLNHYSRGTLKRVLDDLNACCNWAVDAGLIDENPLTNVRKRFLKNGNNGQKSKRSKQAFEPDEVQEIIDAFKSNLVTNSSHYANFVQFLYFTGCRPEEAIALTWDDVKDSFISINKAYSHGVLKGTKTGDAREFPINNQLRELMVLQRKAGNKNLVFFGIKGGYINLTNFTKRFFTLIVNQLFSEGKIKQKLPTYSLRNTAITLFLRKGLDMTTVASLMGTSEDMIKDHYAAPQRDVQLPEL